VDDDGFAEVLAILGSRALRAEPAARLVEVATDGTATTARALLDEVDPQRRAVARFDLRTATLDDVFLTLTGSTTREAAHV